MRYGERILLTVALATIGFGGTYWASPPAPRYYPLEHTWSMTNVAGRPSMAWYGRSGWGIGVALAIGTLVWTAVRPAGTPDEPDEPDEDERRLSPFAIKLLTIVALLSLWLLAAQIVVHEFRRWRVWEMWE